MEQKISIYIIIWLKLLTLNVYNSPTTTKTKNRMYKNHRYSIGLYQISIISPSPTLTPNIFLVMFKIIEKIVYGINKLIALALTILIYSRIFFGWGRLQQLIEFFGQVTKEDLEWRFPSQTFPGTPI